MRQQSVPLSLTSQVVVQDIRGDLRAVGWERAELMARTDGEKLHLTAEENKVQIDCDGALVLYLPRQAALQIGAVSGDAVLQALDGPVRIASVSGDLSMRELQGTVASGLVGGNTFLRLVSEIGIDSVAGDFMLQNGRGKVSVKAVGGDASLRTVTGEVYLGKVGSDVYLRNLQGSLQVRADGEAVIYLQPQPGAEYHLVAGEDLILRLPPKAEASFHLEVNNPALLHVDLPGVSLSGEQPSYDFVLGERTESLPRIFLSAGGELMVTNRTEEWKAAEAWDDDWRMGISPIPPIPPIPPLSSEIAGRVSERLQAVGERVRHRVEAARRRAEIKAEASLRRAAARRHSQGREESGAFAGRRQWNVALSHPESQDISDEERLAILRMLQEKKISVEEAEKLLAALEGK